MIDQDFPIPENEKIIGDEYRVQNGKFRAKQLKDISTEDMSEYLGELLKRTTAKKEWELELIQVFSQYLSTIDPKIGQ